MGYERCLYLINAPACREHVFDAVVIRSTEVDSDALEAGTVGLPSEVMLLAEDIRSLPANVAMLDGKKWNSIPVVLLSRDDSTFLGSAFDPRSPRFIHVEVAYPTDDNNYGGTVIRESVEAYRHAVLSEYDDMGFVVQYERGRYRVNPALRSRGGLDGRYYFGPADERPAGLVTVHRENFGIQVEVEAFEALINRSDVNETELQQFFESHPHFLSHTHVPMPHVRLKRRDGSVLIPDFILKPIVAQQRDSRWEVLDLKLPQVKLLAGRGSRAQLSSVVMKAIRQLRDYREHFENPEHAREVTYMLGHALKRPQLGVLVGRLANTDVGALEREQQYLSDVKIVTYDEILEQQRVLVAE